MSKKEASIVVGSMIDEFATKALPLILKDVRKNIPEDIIRFWGHNDRKIYVSGDLEPESLASEIRKLMLVQADKVPDKPLSRLRQVYHIAGTKVFIPALRKAVLEWYYAPQPNQPKKLETVWSKYKEALSK